MLIVEYTHVSEIGYF